MSEEQVDDVRKPPRKRQKYGKSEAAKQSKKIQDKDETSNSSQDYWPFSALCEDVVIEVFLYLTPLDLLHLSWTSKTLHKFLTTESLAWVWKKARTKNILEGIPDCFDGIKEPQYANLMFGEYCFFCLNRSHDRRLNWRGRFKTCTECVKKETLFMLPSKTRERLAKDKIDRKDVFEKSLPQITIFNVTQKVTYYHIGTYERWVEDYHTTRGKKKWLDSKVQEAKMIDAYNEDSRSWLIQWRGYVLNQHRKRVMEHLKKIGWEEELGKMDPSDYSLSTEPIHKACREQCFTETDLIKLEPHLKEIMERIQSKRIIDDRHKSLKKRVPVLVKAIEFCQLKLPPNAIVPNVGDVFRVPLVLDIINTNPNDLNFTQDNLTPLIEAYPEITRQWRLEKDAELVEMIRSASGESYTFNPDTVLRLATTMFSCGGCIYNQSTPVWYPRVLIHDDTISSVEYPAKPDADTTSVYQISRSSPWNIRKRLKFLKDEMVMMSGALKELGFDPEVITAEELDTLDPILECVPCNDPRQGRFTMKWKHVGCHIRDHHWKGGTPEPSTPYRLEMLQGQEAESIRDRFAEDNAFDKAKGYESLRSMICVHCRQMERPRTLAQHIWEQHGIALATEADMVPNIDVPLPVLSRYSWPPRITPFTSSSTD